MRKSKRLAVEDARRPRRHKNPVQCGMLEWVLEEEKGHSEKPATLKEGL